MHFIFYYILQKWMGVEIFVGMTTDELALSFIGCVL